MAASEVAGILVRWLLEDLMLTLIFSATCEGTAVTLMGVFFFSHKDRAPHHKIAPQIFHTLSIDVIANTSTSVFSNRFVYMYSTAPSGRLKYFTDTKPVTCSFIWNSKSLVLLFKT